MKKQTNPFNLLSKEQMEKLTTVISETLVKPKTFSTADLWNIQRRSRTMMNRRHFA
jgi:hypothetical protein